MRYSKKNCFYCITDTVFLPTHNRENYHHKIKNVPCNCEEVTTEGKNLNQAFSGEDHDEDQVDLVEDGFHTC